MTRSVWKGPFVDITLVKKAKKVADSGRKEVIKRNESFTRIKEMFWSVGRFKRKYGEANRINPQSQKS